MQIGITERGDAFFDNTWEKWVFEEQKPTILITKSPVALIKKYPGLFIKDNNGNLEGNVILHATITGLGGTPFEPNVRPYQEQLGGLKEFLDNKNFCKERLVIRQDPIFPTFVITDRRLNSYRYKLTDIYKFAFENGLRYRISFFDYYPHVKQRFAALAAEKDDIHEYICDLNSFQPELHLSLELRNEFYNIIKAQADKHNATVEVCGEPGLPCTGCLSQKDLDTFGINLESEIKKGFQRPACACLGIKHELLKTKHPCKHNCAYCYWKD